MPAISGISTPRSQDICNRCGEILKGTQSICSAARLIEHHMHEALPDEHNVTTFVIMDFEWDQAKDERNFAKHGIRFDEAKLIFSGPVLTSADDRLDYGEKRQISIGEIEGIVTVVVIHTARNGRIRLISARLANRKERRLYDAFVTGKN